MDAIGTEQTWNDQNIEQLKQLYAEGLSGSEIAAMIGGMSRNAVIGKVHRLGLVLRGKTPAKPKVAKPKPRALHWTGFPKRKSPDRKPPMIVDNHQSPKVECVPLNVPFLELEPGQCKFPYGDAAPFLFCGLPSEDEKPYCPAHSNICNTHAPRRGYGTRPDYTCNLRKSLSPKTMLHGDTIDPTNPEQLPDVA